MMIPAETLDLLNEIEYTIFDGQSFKHCERRLAKNYFKVWYEVWSQHFETVSSTFKLSSDDLLRCDYITCLNIGHNPIAFHCYSIWDLREAISLRSRYFGQYPQKSIDKIANLTPKVMSMEHFFVLPEWRKRKINFGLSEVLAGLGMKIAYQSGVQGIISVARQESHADKRGYGWGLEKIGDVVLHNNPCAVVHCSIDEVHIHQSEIYNYYTEKFWRDRIEVSEDWAEDSRHAA